MHGSDRPVCLSVCFVHACMQPADSCLYVFCYCLAEKFSVTLLDGAVCQGQNGSRRERPPDLVRHLAGKTGTAVNCIQFY